MKPRRGIMNVMLKYNIPIGFGVLTTQNLKQAEIRSHGKENKGKEAAEAALSMIKFLTTHNSLRLYKLVAKR